MNTQRFSEKTSKYVLKGVYIANGCLLLCHVYFLIMFKYIGADIMHYVNYLSVLTYVALFFVLKHGKKKPDQLVNATYVIGVYLEMYIHMVIATICLGDAYGFSLYCFSNASSVVCAAYFLGREKLVTRIADAFVGLNVITYFALRMWTYSNAPIYEVDPVFSKTTFMGNALLVLGFAFYFSKFFATVTNKQEDTLQNVADYDMLTNLRNRRAILKVFNEHMNRCVQEDKLLCVAILDADHFKKVNDTYGHDAGDVVLKTLAGILSRNERENKDLFCGRWGGEEFLITYLLKKNEKEKAIETLEDIRKEVEAQVIQYQDEEIRYTVTIGAAFCNAETTDGYIITEADQMLYQGKEKSRNCVMYE